MIFLRPHHLLCTQSYEGMGYSDAFTANMDHITELLRSGTEAAVRLVFSADILCGCCPHMLGNDMCDSQGNVSLIDKRITEEFGLEEGIYNYSELTAMIDSRMTEELLRYICCGCEWLECSACIERICRAAAR